MKLRHVLTLMIVPLLLQGCALLQPKEKLVIKGGGFLNLTDSPIEQVALEIEATHELISCSYIAPKGFFGTGFPERAYQQHKVVVSWSYRGTTRTSAPFIFPALNPAPDEPVVAVVRIAGDHIDSAEFVPVSKIPARYRR